ncbi:MAG: nucleotidyltransferase domain-containing protein [bacterium]
MITERIFYESNSPQYIEAMKTARLAAKTIKNSFPEARDIYVFGSLANKRLTDKSDIDIAVVCGSRSNLKRLEELMNDRLKEEKLKIVEREKPYLGIDLHLIHDWEFQAQSEKEGDINEMIKQNGIKLQ